MNTLIDEMLKKYNPKTIDEKTNAVKEIIQEIVLCGLARSSFFHKTAFYGGTSLRIFHGLDRFSEDLDFSLLKTDLNFKLEDYFPFVKKEVNSYGLNLKIEEKIKSIDSNIKSAFLKGNTKELLLYFYPDNTLLKGINKDELIKIKIEVDINPPEYATFQHLYKLTPSPYEILLYDLPSLFSGKIHAILTRNWKQRIKGRDLYDYLFFLKKDAPFNLKHLNERLKQSETISNDSNLTLQEVKNMLNNKFSQINYKNAKEDVYNFLKDQSSLSLWSETFFIEIDF